MSYDSMIWTIGDITIRVIFSFMILFCFYYAMIKLFDFTVIRRSLKSRRKAQETQLDPHVIACKSCGIYLHGRTKLESFQNYSEHYSSAHQ